ncbi:IS1182 family transposase [Streptomyces sp. TLI_146]|uniref:IS1182 family transposase n=1 Tax=Streptomyces sp. TLI_146 TaxID=1938858 RepID=UPI000CB6A185|nr:IS1182 family transposase [Streptomyces sp. TLI_146]PKV82810.1 transposase [Streptomyces sp. TLI_146]
MAMGSSSGRVIPPLTVRMARASNPRGTAAMWVRDRLDELFTDEDFADWFPADGRRGLSPARLAMVSVLQYAENLTDRQAAEAVRCRLDWKYWLGLELDDPGFDFSVLSEFRDRMAQDGRADRLRAVMIEHMVAAGLVKRHGQMRTDSTHVLAAARKLNRVELVAETLRAALEELAAADDAWLAPMVTTGWAKRYGRPARYGRLPKAKEDLAAYVLLVGEDGMRLLRLVYQDGAPPRLRALVQVQVLRQVWIQQYWYDADGQLSWRGPKDSHDRLSRRGAPRRLDGPGEGSPGIGTARLPWSSTETVTPHDAEARFAHRPGKAAWVGYKDHQTETCDSDGPNVIVHVTTQTAPEQDISTLEPIHRALAERDLLPAQHLVDAGYVSPAAIPQAAVDHGVMPLGPVRPGSPRLRHPGFDKQDFHIDWDQHTATCPRGVTSPPWNDTQIAGQLGHSVLFPRAACRACEDRLSCTGNTGGRGRHLFLMPRPQQEIQDRARAEQETLAWKARYAMRAGCEATVSETVHAHGLRHCRYRGLAKVHVQHVLTAAGTNIIRLSECFPPGTTPPRTPRPLTPFQRLCQNTENPPAA